jgi:hypothetical protein
MFRACALRMSRATNNASEPNWPPICPELLRQSRKSKLAAVIEVVKNATC